MTTTPAAAQSVPDRQSTLTCWLDYWQSIHATAIDLGLERVRPVAAFLDVLTPQIPVITVAGTNGKGSTTTAIASIYRAAGLKVALYQSPHIYLFNERIRIDGESVQDHVLIDAFVAVEAARQAAGLTLSFFEATTLAAFWIFKQAVCDVWVLEVGLGGRLDVVNLIAPSLAVITNIGIDHVEWLGDTRELIGFEKAGILRAGIPLIFGEADMPQSVRAQAEALQCPVIQYGRDFFWRDQSGLVEQASAPTMSNGLHETEGASFTFATAALTLSVPSGHLASHNLSVAMAAILAGPITISSDHLRAGMISARLAGRFEQHIYQGLPLIVDVAHNPHGVMFLRTQLDAYRKLHVTNRIHAVFSMLGDKDIASVVDLMRDVIDSWHIAVIDVPRAASLGQLQTALDGLSVTVYPTINDALQGAGAAAYADDILLAWGSFHTIEALHLLDNKIKMNSH